MSKNRAFVWVFHGMGGRFASGVFEDRDTAETWINENGLQGVLTRYPVGVGVYDWAIKNGSFTPKNDQQKHPSFIQKFSSASLEHYHFEED